MFKLLLFFLPVKEQRIAAAGFQRAAEPCLTQLVQRLTLATGVVIFMMIWDCRAQLWGAGGASRVRSDSNVKELSGEVTQGLKQ